MFQSLLQLAEVPKVNGDPVNAVDNFIYEKLEALKLKPAAKADKEILLRRASFDLIGLPPTEEEIETFVSDTSEDAFEKQIDRLLASPHYGERMTLDWMDVARYADTHGYSNDRYRDTSPWVPLLTEVLQTPNDLCIPLLDLSI